MTTTILDSGELARTTRKSGARTARSASSAHDEFGALVADAEDLLQKTVDSLGAEMAAARARLQQTVAKARERLSAGVDAVSSQAKETATATDKLVRDNPWQALGVAAVAGLAIGVLIARR